MKKRKRRISMQDIASKLNISKNSVSLALMNKPGVSDELRERIIAAAKELGYGEYADQRQAANNIAILVPASAMSYQDNDHFHFYHDLLWGLEGSARSLGYNAVIATIDEEMEQALRLPGIIRDIQFAGLILFGVVSKDYAHMVSELQYPLIMFDTYYRDVTCSSVTSANVEGAYEAVSYLVQQGHRSIGYIGSANLTTSRADRWYGYTRALYEADVIPDPTVSLVSGRSYNVSVEEIEPFIAGLPKLPTAFFCGNDNEALALINVLQRRGLKVPEDISVMGFDDLKEGELHKPALSTVKVDKPAMCHAALQLIEIMQNHPEAQLNWRIKGELVLRESVIEGT
jgi:DNA-binding LacI/PurR family transcriptional regulator